MAVEAVSRKMVVIRFLRVDLASIDRFDSTSTSVLFDLLIVS